MSCVRSSSGGCSLALSIPLVRAFLPGLELPSPAWTRGHRIFICQNFNTLQQQSRARQRVVLRLVLSPPVVILKHFCFLFYFLFCLFWGYFITVSRSRHCISARKRRSSAPLTFLVSRGGFAAGCFLMQKNMLQKLAKFLQKARNPANTDPDGGRESTASSNAKVKHIIIPPAAGWGNTNPAFCHNKSQHSREKLPQAGGPYPNLSYYKCSNLPLSTAVATRASCPCLWLTWASSSHMLCCKTSCSSHHPRITLLHIWGEKKNKGENLKHPCPIAERECWEVWQSQK